MHAYRTKTGFFRNSSAKLKVNTEKRKDNGVKASSTKYFRFVFCINMLVCIINVRDITVMPFIRKIFSKAYLGGVCVFLGFAECDESRKKNNKSQRQFDAARNANTYICNEQTLFLSKELHVFRCFYLRLAK